MSRAAREFLHDFWGVLAKYSVFGVATAYLMLRGGA